MNSRKATHHDISGCNDIDAELGFITKEEIFSHAIDNSRLFVAEENGNVVGYLRYGYIWDEELPFIQMIRVKKEQRGKGVGKQLVFFLESELATKGFKVLVSSTDESNEGSIAFHKNLGFSECGRLAINDEEAKEIFFLKQL